jgi:hypothetical protein
MSLKLPSIDIFEIRSAKNGLKVPYINGVHLHSIYNPIREAETLVKSNIQLIREKPTALILGLGLAYHVHKIADALNQHHDQYHIMIIDPCIQSYQYCIDNNIIDSPSITVKAGIPAEEVYQHNDVIDFLVSQPSLIAHPASFNLYDEYYKDFLSHRAQTNLGSLAPVVANSNISSLLSEAPKDITLDEWLLSIREQPGQIDHNEALLLLAFEKISSTGRLQDTAENS